MPWEGVHLEKGEMKVQGHQKAVVVLSSAGSRSDFLLVPRFLYIKEGRAEENEKQNELLQNYSMYCGVLSKWEFFIKMKAALLASILPRVMKEGESKEGSSHFDEKLSIW